MTSFINKIEIYGVEGENSENHIPVPKLSPVKKNIFNCSINVSWILKVNKEIPVYE